MGATEDSQTGPAASCGFLASSPHSRRPHTLGHFAYSGKARHDGTKDMKMRKVGVTV